MYLAHKMPGLALGKKTHVHFSRKFPCFKLYVRSCFKRNMGPASHLREDETAQGVGVAERRGTVSGQQCHLLRSRQAAL